MMMMYEERSLPHNNCNMPSFVVLENDLEICNTYKGL